MHTCLGIVYYYVMVCMGDIMELCMVVFVGSSLSCPGCAIISSNHLQFLAFCMHFYIISCTYISVGESGVVTYLCYVYYVVQQLCVLVNMFVIFLACSKGVWE